MLAAMAALSDLPWSEKECTTIAPCKEYRRYRSAADNRNRRRRSKGRGCDQDKASVEPEQAGTMPTASKGTQPLTATVIRTKYDAPARTGARCQGEAVEP